MNETSHLACGEAGDAAGPACPRCGAGALARAAITSLFWHGGELLMVRGIPALVCDACGEDFVTDPVAIALDRLKGEGFSPAAAVDHLRVPVFDFPPLFEVPPGLAGRGA